MNFTTSGIEPYVNTCDKSYADEQMAKWRAWRDGKRTKLRGEAPDKPQPQKVTVQCETCSNTYQVKKTTLDARKSNGARSLCRRCVGRLGAAKKHGKIK